MSKTLKHVRLETARIFYDIENELKRAREKFPNSDGSMTALTEEVGELAKAMLDEPLDRVRAEAIQVAVMAIRVATEGDATLNKIRKRRGT